MDGVEHKLRHPSTRWSEEKSQEKSQCFLDIVMKLSLLIAEIGSHLGLCAASLQFTLTNKDASGSIRQPTYNINKWVT